MLEGVWTSSEFKSNTKSKSIFGKRGTLLKTIEAALDSLHAAAKGNQLPWLYVAENACKAWIDAHPDTSSTPVKGKKTSNRRKGIETLLGQIKVKKDFFNIQPIAPKELNRRARITAQYETSDKDLLIAPGDKDPRLMKGRAAFHQELLERTIKRAEVLGHDKEDFNTEQLGFLAAKTLLKVDSVIDVKKRGACKVEAMRVLCAMLGKNRVLAQQFEATGIEVVVVPADRPMTDLVEFASLNNVPIVQEGGTPRYWNETRGVGGLVSGGKMYVAVTEENLLGTDVSQGVKNVGGGCYAARYSTTSHEFAHGIHKSTAMTPTQVATIKTCFDRKKGKVRIDSANDRVIIDGSLAATQPALDQLFNKEWADGPRKNLAALPVPKLYWVQKGSAYVMASPGVHFQYRSAHELQDCYAAFDEYEYFAQCVNAYLGANGGNDPYTGRPRHNGEPWIRTNEEPEMVRLLDELFSAGTSNHYGQSRLDDTNVSDSGVDVPTVADYIKMRVAAVKNQKFLTEQLVSRRKAMGYDEDDD